MSERLGEKSWVSSVVGQGVSVQRLCLLYFGCPISAFCWRRAICFASWAFRVHFFLLWRGKIPLSEGPDLRGRFMDNQERSETKKDPWVHGHGASSNLRSHSWAVFRRNHHWTHCKWTENVAFISLPCLLNFMFLFLVNYLFYLGNEEWMINIFKIFTQRFDIAILTVIQMQLAMSMQLFSLA